MFVKGVVIQRVKNTICIGRGNLFQEGGVYMVAWLPLHVLIWTFVVWMTAMLYPEMSHITIPILIAAAIGHILSFMISYSR